jgi:hypothetical protein
MLFINYNKLYGSLLFLLTFYLLSHVTSNAQTFPQNWLGKWSGTLEIHTAEGLSQSLPMQLHLLPTDSTHRYTWTIIYGTDTVAGKRAYELVTLDAAKGWYAVDEKNTIVMEAYLLGGKLFNRFEVMGNLLLCTTERVGDHLIFEIISGKLEPVSTTGNQKFKGEDIPPVRAYPVAVRQVAVLKKQL